MGCKLFLFVQCRQQLHSMSHRSSVVSVFILRRFPLKENTQLRWFPSQFCACFGFGFSWFCTLRMNRRSSRKLVSASWNLFCFKKVLGGWNFQPPEIHSYLPSSLPTVGTSPLAAHSAGSASSASVCFHAKFLTKLTFVPYKLTFVLNYRASTTRPCANAGNIIENNRKNNWKL